jgi:hypothetical protein
VRCPSRSVSQCSSTGWWQRQTTTATAKDEQHKINICARMSWQQLMHNRTNTQHKLMHVMHANTTHSRRMTHGHRQR